MLLRKRLSPLLWTVYLTTFYTCGCLGQADVCGRPPLNTRIVGGQDAPAGHWPWQASVHLKGSFICGGALINEQWVLSAASCFPSVSASELEVYLGRQNQNGNNPNELKMTVSRIVNHASHNVFTTDNNIALLQLSRTVSFTNYIRPVCLAASGSVFPGGVTSWVTGWGNTGREVPLPSPGTLQEVKVAVINNTQCNLLFRGIVTDNMMCAGVDAGGKGPCMNDVGGPLVSKQDSVWVQSGIASIVEGCGQASIPGVYTRVSRYQTWINDQISTNQPGFVQFTGAPVVSLPLTTPETVTTPPATVTTPPSATVTTPPATVTTPPSAIVTTPPATVTTPPSATVTTPPSATVTTPPATVTTPPLHPLLQSPLHLLQSVLPSAATAAPTTTTTTTTTTNYYAMCKLQDSDKIGIPAVIVKAFTKPNLNNTTIQSIIETSDSFSFPAQFDSISSLTLDTVRNLNMTLRFKLSENGSICFPSQFNVNTSMRDITEKDQTTEQRLEIEVRFRTVIIFETCESGQIDRVIDEVYTGQIPIYYKRTIVKCRRPQRSRTRRSDPEETEVEMLLEFDPDALSNSASGTSNLTFPTKSNIVATLRTVSTKLNFTINETSITFTEPVSATSVTSSVTSPEPVSATSVTSSVTSPGVLSANLTSPTTSMTSSVPLSAQSSSTVSCRSSSAVSSRSVVVTFLSLLLLLFQLESGGVIAAAAAL